MDGDRAGALCGTIGSHRMKSTFNQAAQRRRPEVGHFEGYG